MSLSACAVNNDKIKITHQLRQTNHCKTKGYTASNSHDEVHCTFELQCRNG